MSTCVCLNAFARRHHLCRRASSVVDTDTYRVPTATEVKNHDETTSPKSSVPYVARPVTTMDLFFVIFAQVKKCLLVSKYLLSSI